MNAVTGAQTDTFNNLPRSSLSSSPTLRTVGTYQYTASVNNDFWNVGSSSDVWLSPNSHTFPISFLMNAGTPTAMGGFFFATDVNGTPVSSTIDVSINGGQFLQTIFTSSATNFFGWISNDGTSIANFEASVSPSTWTTVNDLVLAQAVAGVPDKGGCISLAILGCAAAGIRLRRRR